MAYYVCMLVRKLTNTYFRREWVKPFPHIDSFWRICKQRRPVWSSSCMDQLWLPECRLQSKHFSPCCNFQNTFSFNISHILANYVCIVFKYLWTISWGNGLTILAVKLYVRCEWCVFLFLLFPLDPFYFLSVNDTVLSLNWKILVTAHVWYIEYMNWLYMYFV